MVLVFSFNQTAKAAQLVTGTFVDVTYSEYTKPDGTIEKQLSKVTLQNNRGRTVTYNINKNTRLFINNTSTTIEGFKLGMEVEADISLRSVVSKHIPVPPRKLAIFKLWRESCHKRLIYQYEIP